jgi:hypothetical protein
MRRAALSRFRCATRREHLHVCYACGSWSWFVLSCALWCWNRVQDPAIRPTCTGTRGGDLEWLVVRGYGHIPGNDVQTAADFFSSSLVGNTLLQFKLELQRRPEYFVSNVIVWLLVAVLIAWLSFFVSRYAAPARVGMSFTCLPQGAHSALPPTPFSAQCPLTAWHCVHCRCLLAIYNLQGSVLSVLPRMSDDVWLLTFMNTTLWFVVFAMIECDCAVCVPSPVTITT